MLRVCGAEGEQKALDQHLCWCRGVFCGRGGGRMSKRFFKDFRTKKIARSRAQLEEIVCQIDLFDGGDKREEWLSRLRPAFIEKPKPARARRGATAAAQSDAAPAEGATRP